MNPFYERKQKEFALFFYYGYSINSEYIESRDLGWTNGNSHILGVEFFSFFGKQSNYFFSTALEFKMTRYKTYVLEGNEIDKSFGANYIRLVLRCFLMNVY